MKRTHPRRTALRETSYRNANALSWLYTLVVVVLVCFLLFFVWLRPLRIQGDSMSPALNEDEVVLVDRLSKYWKQPQRGDAILFEDEFGIFVKRVIALPGETVDIKEGRVFIDSRPLDESAYANEYKGDMDPLTVPEGAVFVLGDNRSLVYDSRLETVGCIPYADIQGVLRLRTWPITRFTLFF